MLHSITLFLHILGALGLFAAIGIELAALAGLRRATTSAELRESVRLLGTLRRVAAPSMVLLLVTGIVLSFMLRVHGAWLVVGMAGIVLMAATGRTLIRRRTRAIAQSAEGVDGSLSPAVRQRIQDPVLHAAAWLRVALGVGIVFDMAVKPDATQSILALVVALAIGALVAARTVRRPVLAPQ